MGLKSLRGGGEEEGKGVCLSYLLQDLPVLIIDLQVSPRHACIFS